MWVVELVFSGCGEGGSAPGHTEMVRPSASLPLVLTLEELQAASWCKEQ